MEMVKVQAALAYLSSDNARPVVGCGDASAVTRSESNIGVSRHGVNLLDTRALVRTSFLLLTVPSR